MVRSALYEAANVMLTRAGRFSSLKRWAMAVAGRRGMKRAKVALARKLASVLHRMWLDGTGFRFGKEVAAAGSAEEEQVSEQADRPAPPRSRRRDAGSVKPVIREWPRSLREPRAPRLARRPFLMA